MHGTRKIALVMPVLLLGAMPAAVSDPVGVYALIDRVDIEPATGPAERIRIEGVFAISDGQSGDNYLPPVRGYLYYRVDGARTDVYHSAHSRSHAEIARIEWNDLKTVAGSGQAIGFGGRYENNGRIRRPGDAPENPDVYPLGIGVVKVLRAHLGQAIERDLRLVPGPLRPADGSRVPPGTVRLATPNVQNARVRYIFAIEDAEGRTEVSEPIAPGEGETSWTPQMRLRAGQTYEWSVHVAGDGFTGEAASARLTVPNEHEQGHE